MILIFCSIVQSVIYSLINYDKLQFHYDVYYMSAPSLFVTILGTIYLWFVYLCVVAFIVWVIYKLIKSKGKL